MDTVDATAKTQNLDLTGVPTILDSHNVIAWRIVEVTEKENIVCAFISQRRK